MRGEQESESARKKVPGRPGGSRSWPRVPGGPFAPRQRPLAPARPTARPMPVWGQGLGREPEGAAQRERPGDGHRTWSGNPSLRILDLDLGQASPAHSTTMWPSPVTISLVRESVSNFLKLGVKCSHRTCSTLVGTEAMRFLLVKELPLCRGRRRQPTMIRSITKIILERNKC